MFLSVSLSEAGAEDAAAPPERRGQAATDVQKMIGAFLSEPDGIRTRFKPSPERSAIRNTIDCCVLL